MAGILGRSGSAQAKQASAAAGMKVQTSVYGKAIPIVYGTTKIAPNLLWYGDFNATAYSGGAGAGAGKGGAVGGGGGKGAAGSASYTYTAAVMFGLCEGPVTQIGNIWASKTLTSTGNLGLYGFEGDIGQAPWSYLDASHAAIAEVHDIPRAAPYEVLVSYTDPFETDYGVVDAASGVVFIAVTTPPTIGQYNVSSAGIYTFNAGDAGEQVTISYTAGNQQPPNQALGYSALAYMCTASFQLGSSPQMPNLNFEVGGKYCQSATDSPDADPSLVVADLLSNPTYGAGFPAARIGSLSTYQAYALAAGLFISPAYTDTATASSLLSDIATYTNAAFVWSSGLLTLVPYGDQALSGRMSYTPPASPLFDLTDDDFLPNTNTTGATASSNDDPVLLTRTRPADQINAVQLEFLNRANAYNPEVVEAKDQAAINLYGLRTASAAQAHLLADAAIARLSAQLVLQRQAVRNIYQFTLDQRYIVLDPMDIVTLTDAALGLNQQWVRITEITEQTDSTLSFVAEEYLAGTGTAAAYSFNTSAGYSVNYNSNPGNALSPVIFDASPEIAESGTEVWLATAGGSNWGGCDVWVSSDGATYKFAGTMKGGCRLGATTSALPVSADPDTADTLGVDLTTGGQTTGTLLSGTQADADAYHTLCWLGGELISYETATLGASGKYALSYLRRGAYDSAIAAHAAGTPFVRLDDSIFKYPYAISQIGQTISVKLVSFNLYGGALQDIADVPAYSYQIQGPVPPAAVEGFGVQQNGSVVVFSWLPVPDYFLKGYDIGYAPQGTTDWSAITPLTTAASGTEMTNAAVPPGTWVFAIRAQDMAGQLSAAMAMQDLVVVNENPVVASMPQAPDWLGTLTGFVKHWTGMLVPDSTMAANQMTNAELFETFVPYPVASATYDAPVIDTGFDDTMRVWAATAATLVAAPPAFPPTSLPLISGRRVKATPARSRTGRWPRPICAISAPGW